MKRLIKQMGKHVPLAKRVLMERDNLYTDIGVLQLEKGQLEAEVRELQALNADTRAILAQRFIEGDGIEIGAAQSPVKLPSGASVKYVDIFTAEELRRAWPRDYTKLDIVTVDVVDDGEKLTKFKAASLDFIIANHFIEHCLDPIGTIINMVSKLAEGGVLFYGIPDKRLTFDGERAATTYEHLLDEHRDSGKTFLWSHTEEFVRLGDKYKGNIEKRTQEIIDSGYRVHYHVWTLPDMLEMFVRIIADFSLPLEIKAMIAGGNEVVFVLEKLRVK